MDDYSASTYGDRIAEEYDSFFDDWFSAQDVEDRVDFLASQSTAHTALELGVGTGRLAIALSARGVSVHGLDASAGMLERLRANAGDATVTAAQADIVDFDIGRIFGLVYIVFNTLFMLRDQAAQLSCLKSAARHLGPGGCVVVEAFVPDLTRWTAGQAVRTERLQTGEVLLLSSTIDQVSQVITSQQILIREAGIRLFPERFRYAWPAELDLMARVAGLTLRERHADWRREPFTAESKQHISVYSPET